MSAHWTSLSAFLAMGGYAFYVWGAYGVSALLIGAEIALVCSRRRRVSGRARDTRP